VPSLTPHADSAKSLGLLFETIRDMRSTDSCIYFVLTGNCMDRQLGSPCQVADLGMRISKNIDILAVNPGSIGERIAATLKPGNFTYIDLDLLAQKSDEDNELQKTYLPVADIYIYCSPCACLVATALSICSGLGQHATTFFQFSVRPDDRLISSCCPNEDRSLGLTSIVQEIKRREVAGYSIYPLSPIDRQWVEQRLFEIEETEPVQSFENSVTLAKQLFASHRSNRKTAGIVLLGELEYCLQIMQSVPFVSKPRIPRETEIFQMKKASILHNTWNRTYLGTYTAKSVQRKSTSTTVRASSSSASIPSAQPTLSTLHKISPPPSPVTKRQKTSSSPSVTMEGVSQGQQKASVIEAAGTSI
jgi:hypothetical protein